jgi:hypothetical protein
MVLMPSKPPIPPNQPPHPINAPLRPPPQQHPKSRIHNLRLAPIKPLENLQSRLEPSPRLPAYIIPRRFLDPPLRLEPFDWNLFSSSFDIRESVHDVFERVDVGTSQQEDVLVCLGDDARGESCRAAFGDQHCDPLAEFVPRGEGYFALRDGRLEGREEDFGRGWVPVEVEGEGVDVDACS